MMQNPIRPIVVGIRPSDDTDHRQVLTVRSGDRVEEAQPTHGERHHARSDATRPSIPVGRVPCIELVAAADVIKPRLGYKVVEESEVKVSRHRENILHADLHQPPRHMAAEGGVGGSRRAVVGFLAGEDGGVVSGGSCNVGVVWLARV